VSTSARDFFFRFAAAMLEQDFATLEQMIHPDFVSELPQSGERSRGFAGFRAQLERYPGGSPTAELPDARMFGDEDRWAITPSYTVVPLAGRTEFTVLMRTRYPDGSWWRVILLVELRDERLFRIENYFAPELEPPLMAKIGSGAPG
jgi:hypothetical protein